MPTLPRIAEAMSCAASGRAPAEASPPLQASPAATNAAAMQGRERAKGMKCLLRDENWVLEEESTAVAIIATSSASRASSSAVGSPDTASKSLATLA
jgi:hypothetical protein